MDSDALKSLGTLLLWGGFFYIMMRYGCGKHMMSGHGKHRDAASEGKVKDPVCSMAVDPSNAAAAAVRRGSTYYFCSTSCRDKFEQAPDKYAGSSTQSGQQHGGHHHR